MNKTLKNSDKASSNDVIKIALTKLCHQNNVIKIDMAVIKTISFSILHNFLSKILVAFLMVYYY